jgi:hypothetical protein
MKFLKKSALAVAVAASVASIPAMAADYEFTAGSGTVVLANVIFGEGNPGTGSEETLINAPSVLFDLTEGGTLTGDLSDGTVATIKFTLGGDAVFGEDLSTTALLAASNSGNAFVVEDSTGTITTWEVVQGGAIGDNTITVEITSAAAESIETVTFAGYKVKRLTSALKASSSDPRVRLGVEYVESNAADADPIAGTATGTPLVIFGSAEPLTLDGTTVDFNTANFVRINVGNGEKTFTGGTIDGRKDFDAAGDATYVKLGTIQLKRNAIDTTTAFPAALAGLIKKENGADFDFQGGDVHKMVVTAGSGALQDGGTVYLSNAGDSCATNPGVADLTNESVTVDATGVATLDISGTTTALTASYDLCYSVNNTAKIPEASDIKATWTVDFFNSRYDNRDLTSKVYGPLKRNGCIASFFNVPGVGDKDTAFIRLTNTSSTNAGPVIATVYAQDGTPIVEDVQISDTLAQHATQVYTTLGASQTNAHGQSLLSIAEALGIDGDAAEYKGRARVVLKGAFDTCEGLGLLKSGDTGALLNLTATTQGNGPGDGGNNGN